MPVGRFALDWPLSSLGNPETCRVLSDGQKLELLIRTDCAPLEHRHVRDAIDDAILARLIDRVRTTTAVDNLFRHMTHRMTNAQALLLMMVGSKLVDQYFRPPRA